MNAPALVAHVVPEPTRADILAALHELASLVQLCAAHAEGSALR
ncbi:hypothetical protein [Microbacterium lacticum]